LIVSVVSNIKYLIAYIFFIYLPIVETLCGILENLKIMFKLTYLV